MVIEAYAELRISSQTLTPEQIGSRVGLEADKARKKGQQRIVSEMYKGPPIYEKETWWEVRSTLAKREPIEAHVNDLLERLKPAAESIKGLAHDNTVTFACVIYAYSKEDYNPEVVLSRSTVDFLSALGANFWVDMYFLGGS